MGLDLYWHSTRPDLRSWESSEKTVIEEVWDEDDVLVDAVSRLPGESFPVLSGIDPYGDTVLDCVQAGTALEEVRQMPGWPEIPQLVSLAGLLEKCINTPGTCIAFIGD